MRTPPAAAVFMRGTIAVAILVLGWAAATAGFPWVEFPAFVILGLLGALAHLYPIRSAENNVATYVVANTFLFAGVILLSVGWLALLPVALWIPNGIKRYRNGKPEWLFQPAANASQAMIFSVAAHMLLGPWTGPLAPSWLDVGIMVTIIVAFVLGQTLWVAMVVSLARGISLRKLEFWNRDSLISEGVLLCLGAIVALLWRNHPALLILVMTPVAFAYHMLRGVQLIRLGEIDGKTGLYNSRRFEEQFERELASARVLRRPLSLVFLDLDFLRDINNTYGHLAGDAVIVEVARRIREHLRHQDFAARFGGEEFVLLLPGTEVIEGRWVAERIREAVASVPFDIGDGEQIRCSISGGVAAFPAHGSTLAQLTAEADRALYYAKSQGRNRTYAADDVPQGMVIEAGKPAKKAVAPEQAAVAVQPGAAPVSGGGSAATPATGHAAPAPTPAEQPSAPRSEAPAEFAKPGRFQPGLAAVGLMLLLMFLFGQPLEGLELLAAMCAMALAAEYWKVDLLSRHGGKSTVSMGVAVTMAAAVTLGTFGAVAVNLASFAGYVLQARRRNLRILAVNLTIVVGSAVVGSLPFELLQGHPLRSTPWFLGVVLGAGLLYFLVNVGLVAMAVSRRQGAPLAEVWRTSYGWLAPSFSITAACGGLMGSAYLTMGWQAVVVFVLPVLIIRHTYQTYIRQSHEAYETAERGRQALEEAHKFQSRAMDHLLEVVSTIIDARDASVSGHSVEVARYAVAIAEQMGLPAREIMTIRQAALLHDLGKVGIPEAILHKPGKLSPDEWRIMQEHTLIGQRILTRIPGLEKVAQVVAEHHEKYNGKGYPRGLAGEAISREARIVALADALDSIISDRPYSTARPLSWAVEEIERCAGEHFDPAVVAAFRQVVAGQPVSFFVNSASGLVPYAMPGVACARQA